MGGIRCVGLCDVYGVAATGLLVVSKQNIQLVLYYGANPFKFDMYPLINGRSYGKELFTVRP